MKINDPDNLRMLEIIEKRATDKVIPNEVYFISRRLLEAQEAYYAECERLAELFKKNIEPMIEDAKASTSENKFTMIKEYMRNMVGCADNVIIFRKIIIEEKEWELRIKKHEKIN